MDGCCLQRKMSHIQLFPQTKDVHTFVMVYFTYIIGGFSLSRKFTRVKGREFHCLNSVKALD